MRRQRRHLLDPPHLSRTHSWTTPPGQISTRWRALRPVPRGLWISPCRVAVVMGVAPTGVMGPKPLGRVGHLCPWLLPVNDSTSRLLAFLLL